MPMEPLRILYEDAHLVLCVKPVGVLSEDSADGACMPALLRAHYRAQGKPGYIATVHRLDKAVGGVMLFSRRREITGKLTAAIAEHRVTKEYLAVLRGTPEKDSDTLTDLLFRDAAHNKSYVVKRMRKGVREASLDYAVPGASRRPDAGAGAPAHRPHPPDTGAVLLPRSAPAGGRPLRQQGALLPRPVVAPSGADPSRHREAHRRHLSPAGQLAVELICRMNISGRGKAPPAVSLLHIHVHDLQPPAHGVFHRAACAALLPVEHRDEPLGVIHHVPVPPLHAPGAVMILHHRLVVAALYQRLPPRLLLRRPALRLAGTGDGGLQRDLRDTAPAAPA